jgi:oligoribonuclease (3'-5' exoribonuclease)
MHLLAGFAIVLATIAFVQSKPTVSRVTDINAAIASLPSVQNLNSQLNGLLVQLSGSLSPVQLQSLQQQAFQTVQDVLNGNLDVNTAANQLLKQLEQYLGSNSQLLADVRSLVQQFVDAAATLPFQLPSNLGKSRATVARSAPLASANQLQLSDLVATLAAYPQYSDLTNQLSNFVAQISSVLSSFQLGSLDGQASQIIQNVLNGNVDANTAVNQLLEQLQQYLGSNSQLLANARPLVQQFIDAVVTLSSQLPSNLGKRRATVARSAPLASANQLQLSNLLANLAAQPQYSDLINQLSNFAAQITSVLSSFQLESLDEKSSQIVQNVLNGNVDANTAANQLLQQLKQYLGSDSQLLANVQPLLQQFIDAVVTLPFPLH